MTVVEIVGDKRKDRGGRTYQVRLSDGSTRWMDRKELKDCAEMIKKYEDPSIDSELCKRLQFCRDNYVRRSAIFTYNTLGRYTSCHQGR
jgi:hypothetical protein